MVEHLQVPGPEFNPSTAKEKEEEGGREGRRERGREEDYIMYLSKTNSKCFKAYSSLNSPLDSHHFHK
jgi:hypothetical protein